MAVYQCRLCDLAYHDAMNVIGIFSEEGRSSKIAAKILYASSIMVTENDGAPQNICKICWGQVDCFTRFLNKCNVTNEKHMRGLLSSKKEEMLRLMKTPLHLLFRCNKDLQAVYNSLAHYLKKKPTSNMNSILEDRQLLFRQLNTNRNTNPVNSENNAAIANGMPQNSLVNNNNRSFGNYNNENALKIKFKTNEDSTRKSLVNKKAQTILLKNAAPKKHLKFVKTFVRTNGHSASNIDIPNTSSRKNNNYDGDNDTINTTSNLTNSNNEVICLDDDDDANDDGVHNNDHSYTANGVKRVNKWVIIPNNNNNNINKGSSSNISRNPKNYDRRQPALPVFENQILSTSTNNSDELTIDNNVPPRSASNLSNYSTEEISVTPDIEAINMSDSAINQPEVYTTTQLYYVPTGPVVPYDAGFHFLCPTPTVDLTNTDDTMECQTQIVKNKRKSTKNIKTSGPLRKKQCLPTHTVVCSTPNTISLTPLLKKVTNVNVNKSRLRPIPSVSVNVNKKRLRPRKSELQKLKDEIPDVKNWIVLMKRLYIFKYKCSICFKLFASQKLRLHHEQNHSLPPISACSNVDSVCSNEANTEEQEKFLLNLNLVKANKQMSNKTDPINVLLKNKNILNAYTKFGCEVGVFVCTICKYKTRRLCTLWAHNQVNHTNDITTVLNSNPACCICENILSKRTQLLKHVDKCLVKPAAEQKDCEEKTNDKQGNKGKDHSPTSLSVGKIECSRCKTCFSTYKLHHKHVLECALKNVLTRQ